MNKNYIKIMAVAVAVLMTACSQENEIGGGPAGKSGKNTVAFSMGGTATRSASVSEEPTGVIIPLGKNEKGTTFFLQESVVDLNSPVTRGTPAYTENVSTLYGTFAAKSELSGTGIDEFPFSSSTNMWSKTYSDNIWTIGGSDVLNFYMYMPTDMTSKGVSNLAYSGKKITFSYTSQATAADQQDILFSYRELKKDEYDSEKGASVLFHHALTGVKFRIGNDEDDIAANDIAITNITFKGLKNSGSCTVTPRDEKDVDPGVDNPTGDYSSGDGSTVVWNLGTTTGDFSSGTYGDPVGFTTGSFGEKGAYPASFASAYNDQNLNKTDGSQTFWLIPQTISPDVKLSITYKIGSEENTWEVDFGSAIGSVEWKAGQLRTYTIKIDNINVMIEDKVTINGSADDGFSESYKEAVTITNTGNTDAFIRAAIIGQWLDENDNPVFGFTDFTSGKIVLVDSWYQDQFVKTEAGTHGTFVGLPGYKGGTNPLNDWELQSDGYYYYTKVVPAGEKVPDDLFTKYTIGTAPIVTVAGEVKPVYFVLEIATQAVSAKKLDGSEYDSYTEAWANAKAQEE